MMIEIILFLFFAFLLLNYIYFLSDIIRGLKKLFEDNQAMIPEEFEVIYVNDSSTDDSYEKILNEVKPNNFKVISLSDFSIDKAFKKKAVSYGIEHASGEIIVTTDTDCIHDQNWLRELISVFDLKTGFISGPVSFVHQPNLFSKIQSLEFAGLVLSGAGLISIGKPTICNGANLAFRKSVFTELQGYHDQMHLSSGEDELLMQKIAAETDYLVKFCWAKNAVVFTRPNKNIHDFFQQRKRWASKGLFYKNKFLRLRLLLIYLFYLSITVQILLSIFFSKLFLIFLLLCLISKFVLEYKIISNGVDILFKYDLVKYFLISEIFQIIYLTLAGATGILGNFKWKERKLTR